jgi:hypothetical protein
MAAVAEVVGTMAVVITLIFLGLQVRQGNTATEHNTNALESQSESDAALEFAAWHGRVASDPSFMHVWDRVSADADDLDQTEVNRFRWIVGELLFTYEAQYRRWRRGLVTEETWEQDVDVILAFYKMQIIKDFWEIYPFSRGFRDHIQSVLSSGRPTNRRIVPSDFAPERPTAPLS